MSPEKSRMGNMGQQLKGGIRSFGMSENPTEAEQPTPKAKKQSKAKQLKQEKLTTVNIKVTESQQEWLAQTAKQVRANNDAPVPPGDRVYPQHLIQVAIDVLKSQDIDWDEIKTAEDLRQVLNL